MVLGRLREMTAERSTMRDTKHLLALLLLIPQQWSEILEN
jgi:hypothetical protein